MRFLAAMLILLLLEPVFARDSYREAAKHFDYDARAPLDIKEISVRERGGAKIHDITYASPKGGAVPAYLVVPTAKGKGKFAAILWGHWMMPKSPTANRTEFLNEAVALAPAGVVSLMIDAPYVRPGFKADPNPLGSQDSEVTQQQVIDLRRGLDLLLARSDVDAKRVAFVGHSFDAQCGAILDAVDKRSAAFVFMGNPVAVRELVLSSNLPDIVQFRKSVPMDKLKEYLDANGWTDPGTYAAHLGPASALFQYATHDEFVPVDEAKHFFESSSGPKQMKFYDSNHALNAQARRDRYEFLRKHLALSVLPPGALEKVPQTK
jgi:cephalosporin-C deacetylase-like acetyl esterase